MLVAALGAVLTGCADAEPAPPPPPSPTERAPDPLRIRHVDPAGRDDGVGSSKDPWRTLSAAFARLEPGDRLVVHQGEFEEDLAPVVRPGTAERPVSVVAADGATPRVRGLVRLRDPDHWDISGLGVRWRPGTAPSEHMVKVTGGAHWTWRDAEFSGARSYAALLVAGQPSDFRLLRLHVRDTWPTNGTNQDHLVYLNCGTGGGLVQDCELVNSPNGRGVKIGGATSTAPRVANLVLRGNTMRDNLGPSNIQFAWAVADVLVERNLMVRPARSRHNVTFHEVRATRIIVQNNEGRECAGICDWSEPGVVDGGGNVWT